jgi:hypothetical protein
MRRALLTVPNAPGYPYHAILEGLNRAGFAVVDHGDADVLVTWSPWLGSNRHAIQRCFDEARKPVIVMENGWLTPIRGKTFWQVALGGWNGQGTFQAGDAARWHGWDIGLAPWRQHRGGYALVIGQRGHETDRRTAPFGWHDSEEFVLQEASVIVRRSRDAAAPLGMQLARAGEVHVWTSNVASRAVLEGIPVVQYGPTLMVHELASRPGQPLRRPERLPVLERIAWAQWHDDEVRSGEPFGRLVSSRWAA